MEEIVLKLILRQGLGTGHAKRARRAGFVPVVVYGKGKEPLHAQLDGAGFAALERVRRIGNAILALEIYDGEKKIGDKKAMIKEMQRSPFSDAVDHIDFAEVSLTEKIVAHVVIHGQGEAIGVKRDGGILEHPLRELEIRCLPTQIPSVIDVDISGLAVNESVHVRDLSLSADIEVLTGANAVLFLVHPPKVEEVPVAGEVTEEAAVAEPEVIKKGKEEQSEEGS